MSAEILPTATQQQQRQQQQLFLGYYTGQPVTGDTPS